MRLVLDTNVLVSASLKRVSTPALAVHLAQETGALLKSLDTERQVFEVLARPYFRTDRRRNTDLAEDPDSSG